MLELMKEKLFQLESKWRQFQNHETVKLRDSQHFK